MKNFLHLNAKELSEAVSILEQYGEGAKIIAGGTDLLTILKDNVYKEKIPEVLVNIKTITDLDYISEDAEGLKIGATTRLTDIASSPLVLSKYPALAEAALKVASPQIRNLGTIGGNLCQEVRCWYYRLEKDFYQCLRKGGAVCFLKTGLNRFGSIFGGPSGCYAVNPSDIAPALIALNASAKTTQRTIALEDFFKDFHPGHVLKANEILTEIQVPSPASDTKQVFLKNAMRKAIDFPIVNVAVVITPATGTVTDARIVINAVAPVPVRSKDAENILKGNTIIESTAENAAAATVANSHPLNENGYKVQIAKTLVKRAILA